MAATTTTPTVTAKFSFLALPPELRLQIYEELLTTAKPQTFYRNWKIQKGMGLGHPFNLHPAILRVNRQIHAESAWILYEHNVFQIYLSKMIFRGFDFEAFLADPDIPDPGPLFRTDSVTDSGGPLTPHKGLIYPHCLRRLHHIEIVTSGSSILLPRGIGGGYFTEIWGLIIDIWRCIVADDDNDASLLANDKEKGMKGEKSLEIAIGCDSEYVFDVDSWRQSWTADDGGKLHEYHELIELLEKKRRVVWLIAGKVEKSWATTGIKKLNELLGSDARSA